MRLAVATDDRPTSKEIAQQLSVSYLHMTKVITRLAELGIIDARRGRGGGSGHHRTRPHRPVGWLMRRLEDHSGSDEVIECEGPNPCPLRFGCPLRSALRRAQDAFFASLDESTIEDLIRPPTKNVLLALPRVHAAISKPPHRLEHDNVVGTVEGDHPGHPAGRRRGDRRDHPAVLPKDVRRAPRARTRPVQPRQPEAGRAAEGTGRRHRRIREPAARSRPRACPTVIGADRAQACVAGRHRRAVSDRARRTSSRRSSRCSATR